MSRSRREFIKLGSGAIVVATFGRMTPVRAAETTGREFASVGHWGGVPRIARRHKAASFPYLVDAQTVLTGDPAFFNGGARVEVRGFWRPEHERGRAAKFSLDVVYDTDTQEKAPFYAWSFAARGGRGPAIESSQVAFNIPVDALGTVNFVVRNETETQQIRFAVNDGQEALKLRTGYYFIALRRPDDHQPIDWSGIRIREGGGPRFVSDADGMLTVGDKESVPFSYLVLWIDVAGQ